MQYYGYLTKEELVALIDQAFPYVDKPNDAELMLFGDDDLLCRFIKEHIGVYSEPKIPVEGVRYLHSELSNLSPKGMRWLLPLLIRAAVYCNNRHDTLTDCLIYDLESAEVQVDHVKMRYSLLNADQLRCLACVLEYLAEQHWHCIASALQTLERLSTYRHLSDLDS